MKLTMKSEWWKNFVDSELKKRKKPNTPNWNKEKIKRKLYKDTTELLLER